MVGWNHWLNGHEFERILGDTEGQGSLECCSPWGLKELDMTEWLNNIYSSKDITGKLYLPLFNPLAHTTHNTERSEKWKWSRSVVSDCLPPRGLYLTGSSVHGIFQARVLEWGAISFSRGSSQPRDRTRVSHIVGRCFTIWAIREVPRSICELMENFYSEILQTWVEISSGT